MIYAIIFATSLLFTACQSAQNKPEANAENKDVAVNPAHVANLSLNVAGMTCNGCEMTIEKKLGSMQGVVKVKASHTAKTVVIEADTVLSPLSNLKKGIAESGFTVIE